MFFSILLEFDRMLVFYVPWTFFELLYPDIKIVLTSIYDNIVLKLKGAPEVDCLVNLCVSRRRTCREGPFSHMSVL